MHSLLGVLPKAGVGVLVLLLTVLLLLAPVPMIQVVPALVIVLISLAYLEEDGVPALDRAPHCRCLLAASGVALWEMAAGAVWIDRSWL